MAPLAIPKLIGSSLSAIYNPFKDVVLYLSRQRQDIRDLEERLIAIITNLIAIISRKEEIDESLKTSVTTKKSKEYKAMEADVAGILDKYTNFFSKYAMITGNLPPPTAELNDFTAALMIEKLDEIKPTILTANFFKLAKLSRDIERLSGRASRILDHLEPKYMVHKESEPYQEKLLQDNDLQVFNDYVAEILRYLCGNGARVGVVGPIGVGKTTVLNKLRDRLIDTKSLFYGERISRLDNIIWIPVLPVQEIKEKLQAEIMLQLQMDHERTSSLHLNRDRISQFLRDRNYIVLMDNVPESIDLDELGLRENHKYGNVVIASSDKKSISSMIKDEIEIQRLTKEDAWKLFENIHGKIYDMRLKRIGDRIVECCGGLPREIKLVATFLKNKEESSWMDAKRNLQSHTKSVNLMGLGGIDYFYKKRYDDLETYYKKCFRYAALFPNEHSIYKDYLIECWMAERFIEEDDDRKLRRARESGQRILDQLTDMYLLDWSLDKKFVKMPAICRRVALELEHPGEENCLIWVPADDRKPNEETWKTVRRMSLIRCTTKLPQSPLCSNICTLLLQSKPELTNLGDSFFQHMFHLQVLDLYHTEIRVLPGSTGELVNLKSLYLNSCKHLKMLPPQAAELKKLEFLDICGTSIPSLPQVIENMAALRCLRASFSPRGKEVKEPEVIIPLNIIKKLRKLEELSIDTGLYNPPRDLAEKLAKELGSLEYLTTLRFSFPNVSSLNTFVTHSKSLENKETGWGLNTFRSFKIFIGCHETQHPYESDVSEKLAERRLRFINEEFSSSCRELLKQACAFELIGDQSVVTLKRFDLNSLKVCVVGNCSSLENIVDGDTTNDIQGTSEERSCTGVLQNLEKLHLYNLELLEYVWKGPVLKDSLINLTVLTVNGCNRLTKILDPTLACSLRSLKHFKVDNCCEIIEIVGVTKGANNSKQEAPPEISEIVEVREGSSNSEQENHSDILKSVRVIELSNLPKLLSISGSLSINWNSLDSMVIRRCSELSGLSLTQASAKKLASIKCEESWWGRLPLPDGVKQRFSPSFFPEEEPSGIGAYPGETSTSGMSAFNQASNNIDHKTSYGHAIDHPVSNSNEESDAESPEEEAPMNDDLQASKVNENAGDEIPRESAIAAEYFGKPEIIEFQNGTKS